MRLISFIATISLSLLLLGCGGKQLPVAEMNQRLSDLESAYQAKIIDKNTYKDLREDVMDGDDTAKIGIGKRLLKLKEAFDKNAVSVEEYKEVLDDILDGDRHNKPVAGEEYLKLKEMYAKGLISMEKYEELKKKIRD